MGAPGTSDAKEARIRTWLLRGLRYVSYPQCHATTEGCQEVKRGGVRRLVLQARGCVICSIDIWPEAPALRAGEQIAFARRDDRGYGPRPRRSGPVAEEERGPRGCPF